MVPWILRLGCANDDENDEVNDEVNVPFVYMRPNFLDTRTHSIEKEMMSRAKGALVWADYQETRMPALRDTPPSTAETCRDFAVVFIEPRRHPSTEFVLRNLRFHAPTTPIIVVHGTQNEDFIKGITSKISGEFILVQSGVDNLPPPAYNALLTSPAFWNRILDISPWAVIAQSDSILLQSIEAIRPYMDKKYAFVGAPWSYACSVCFAPMDGGCGHMIDQAIVASLAPAMVGNGGFSLRHVPSMMEVLDVYAGPSHPIRSIWPAGAGTKVVGATNEDVFFCKALSLQGKPSPSRAEALEFCIEQVGPLEWRRGKPMSIACHKPWAYLHPDIVKVILNA